MIWMGEALKLAQQNLLKKKNNFMVFGQGVSSDSYGLKRIAPHKVIEMPISEVSFSGMAVGLASQGFRPLVHHIRTEFSLLVLDQILTHASRWEFNFKKDYICPVSFRVGIGRGWGNGPQHTATYHSVFLQSPGLNVMIPAFAQDAYDQIYFLMHTNNPSVILEHRWMYKIGSILKKKQAVKKLNTATLIKGPKKILLLTYGDGLVDCIKVKEILMKNKLDCSIICISFFPAYKRFSKQLLKEISEYKNIYLIDTSPYEFGLLQGIIGELFILSNKKKIKLVKIISPPFKPCPTSAKLAKKYYPNPDKILKKICKNLKIKKKINYKKLNFNEIHLNPEFNISTNYKLKRIY